MTYQEFVKNIDNYVKKTVELVGVMVATGETVKAQRYVWDNKSFAIQKNDALIKVVSVRVIG